MSSRRHIDLHHFCCSVSAEQRRRRARHVFQLDSRVAINSKSELERLEDVTSNVEYGHVHCTIDPLLQQSSADSQLFIIESACRKDRNGPDNVKRERFVCASSIDTPTGIKQRHPRGVKGGLSSNGTAGSRPAGGPVIETQTNAAEHSRLSTNDESIATNRRPPSELIVDRSTE